MSPKHLLLFILLSLFVCIAVAACSLPGEPDRGQEPGDDSPVFGEPTEWMDLTIYFGNNDYDPNDPESRLIVSVTRVVEKTQLVARSTVNELIRGPYPIEAQAQNIGPVIDEAAIIDDIYIKNGICVVLLVFDGSLTPFDNHDSRQAEQMLVESLIDSLVGFPSIDSVWLFQNGSPWQGEFLSWSGPLARQGQSLSLKLFYRDTSATAPDCYIGASLNPVLVEIDSSREFTPENCSLREIVKLLARDLDSMQRASLPRDCKVLGLHLKEGVLYLDLHVETPLGRQAFMLALRSLVYTFTGLPEIDRVLVTLDGEPWSDGSRVWDNPLGKEDLE